MLSLPPPQYRRLYRGQRKVSLVQVGILPHGERRQASI